MVCRIDCCGYDAVKKLIAEKGSSETPLYVLFTGSKDEETGVSWCPDCVKADPVIAEALSTLENPAVFIHAEVGPRLFWKDQCNPFRTDDKLQIKCVPTLLKYNTPQRLEESQLFDLVTVLMMFEDS